VWAMSLRSRVENLERCQEKSRRAHTVPPLAFLVRPCRLADIRPSVRSRGSAFEGFFGRFRARFTLFPRHPEGGEGSLVSLQLGRRDAVVTIRLSLRTRGSSAVTMVSVDLSQRAVGRRILWPSPSISQTDMGHTVEVRAELVSYALLVRADDSSGCETVFPSDDDEN